MRQRGRSYTLTETQVSNQIEWFDTAHRTSASTHVIQSKLTATVKTIRFTRLTGTMQMSSFAKIRKLARLWLRVLLAKKASTLYWSLKSQGEGA